MTLNRQIEKEYRAAECALKHLRNKQFGCEQDAKKELGRLSSKFKYHQMILDKISSVACYEHAGRPKKTASPTKTMYEIEATIVSLFQEKKGCNNILVTLLAQMQRKMNSQQNP